MEEQIADSNDAINITTDIRIETLRKKIMSTICNKKKYKLEVEKELSELQVALKNILIDMPFHGNDSDL